uniref:PremRNAsplicing factor prp46 putative n=1 Tax=Albugo laibachii Nc14 TaxID=890382 RepID=F0WX16_9STRA|nr:premRNAsplicing factor prp46 putative [Albugo laibachii Nc14]|eukprot:CCA26004.1 premRNAsplicing factor prp46 putative [Albugo laibachii Nc14]
MAKMEAETSHEVREKIATSVLRTSEIFALTKNSNLNGYKYAPTKKIKLCTKLNDTYLHLPTQLINGEDNNTNPSEYQEEKQPISEDQPSNTASNNESQDLLGSLAQEMEMSQRQNGSSLQQFNASGSSRSSKLTTFVKKPTNHGGNSIVSLSNNAITRRRAAEVPKPKWHAPWKLKRVISGHLGWVRAIAIDPTNDWFVTGAADRTIKVWDLATGQLRLTLTGHINTIRGLEVSPRHPYLFSAAEDKKVLCWDLECNKVIRSYHGHLSGVFSLKLHPTLDVLITGGRDAVARVWDMRSKQQIHVLSGHHGTVWSLETQGTDPQVITGSADSTIKLWDLAAGKVMTTLTHHKKAIRALVKSPMDHTFVSGAADNIKKWKCREGVLLRNLSGHNAVINSLAINQDGVLVSSADNGSMHFWDYDTGYCFQKELTKVQPGSLDSECGIYASMFDKTGLRLITCEADKTIKVWHEDMEASEESHPIDMKQWTKDFTAPKRY